MYIYRKLESQLTKFLNTPEILAVVGPRQSGKTTLLKHIFEQCPAASSSYINFEIPETLSLFEQNTADFIHLYVKNKTHLFIDEFQYSHHGGKILKQIFDTQKIKIIITGSSAIELTVKALKFLVGRILTFELFPFDFEEFLSYRNPEIIRFYQDSAITPETIGSSYQLPFGDQIASQLQNYFAEYMTFGGYPRVILAQDQQEKKKILEGIFSTFCLREVKDYLGLIDDYKLQSLIKALALQSSNLIEYKELSSISGYTFITLKRYLQFLEKSYICSFIHPFFTNKRKEIIKNPKIYFMDTGLRNHICQDFRLLFDRPDAGALLENAIFMDMRKQGYLPKFWRNKQGKEIDFILESPTNPTAIEVKLSLNKCRQNKNFVSFSPDHPQFQQLHLYFQGFQQQLRTNETSIKTIPCYCWK